MALSFLYLTARRLLGILLGRFQTEHAKDVEIAVLATSSVCCAARSSDPSSAPPIVRSWQC